jgi:subtilisin family serine protease
MRALGCACAAATLALTVAGVSWGAPRPTQAAGQTSVIIRELPGAGSAAERAVEAMGGRVGRRIGLINGFVASVPAAEVPRLGRVAGVHSVTRNQRVRLNGLLDGWDHEHDTGSLLYVAQEVSGAGEFWNAGFRGQGVDVAVIDSGVAPVNGITAPGAVIHGPDLSFESQAPNLRTIDTYGHGTHMAGIIAGRDDAAPRPVQKGEKTHFVGMAPASRIVSLKVADAYGASDVSQVIAAIDWVVQHRDTDGLNIRVLNLSFGTDGTQSYKIDPLAYAVEVAWRRGIVVVVSAGNGGFGSNALNNPAYDPFVIAVGGADGKGTYDWKDDTVESWSSCGDGTRGPDLVAPGASIKSLRVPGSFLDLAHPTARVGATPRFFRGSGTSEAAAVVSGAAALVISQRPSITPDQVKALLKGTANRLPNATANCQGAGMVDLKLARGTATPSPVASAQSFAPSTGTGSLEASRGSAHLSNSGVTLAGEQDIFGMAWDGSSWAPASLAGNSWSGGSWRGNSWSGNSWSGNSWSGNTWSGNSWSGNSWSGNSWSGNTWSGLGW